MPNKRKSFDYRNRYYNSSNNHNTSNLNTSNSNNIESDLPGFYYDPVKNKYFKIESNNSGISNLVTAESIRSKQHSDELNKKIKLLTSKNNMFDIIEAIPFGADCNLKQNYLDNKIMKSQLKKINSFNIDTIKMNDIYFFNKNFESNNLDDKNEDLYLFVNFYATNTWPEVYSYHVFKLTRHDNRTIFNEKIEFVHQQEHISEQLFYPSYIQQKYLVTSTSVQNFRFHKGTSWQVSINSLFLRDDLLEQQSFVQFKYKLPIWCSNLNLNITNSNLTLCATGLSKYCQVNNVSNSMYNKLETGSSDVYCVRFMPYNTDNVLYCGCKNQTIYGFDLRINQKSLSGLQNSISKLHHDLRLVSLEFHSTNSNYLYSNDLTGKVYLWDLRVNKCVNTYFDYNESDSKFSSMKLSYCGNYLYLIPKDGCVRIWNTNKNKLLKIIESPYKKTYYESYAEIPKINLIDNTSFIYTIKNDFFYYTV